MKCACDDSPPRKISPNFSGVYRLTSRHRLTSRFTQSKIASPMRQSRMKPRISDHPYRDSISRIGDDRGWCMWSVNVDGQSTYEEGIYCLAQGIVSIYLQGGPDRTPASRIDFVLEGYRHTHARGTTASPDPPSAAWPASSSRRSSARSNTAHEQDPRPDPPDPR